MTLANSEAKPSVFDLKKKTKQERSCALCEIIATSESGLNAHLNGKKHKIKEAMQNRKICKSNTKSEKIVNVKANDTVDTFMVQKSRNESRSEEKLAKTMVDNEVNAIKLKNEDTANKEAEKISVLTKERKVERLWCEICQISIFSKAMMKDHIKGEKHSKKMNFFEQKNVSSRS